MQAGRPKSGRGRLHPGFHCASYGLRLLNDFAKPGCAAVIDVVRLFQCDKGARINKQPIGHYCGRSCLTEPCLRPVCMGRRPNGKSTPAPSGGFRLRSDSINRRTYSPTLTLTRLARRCTATFNWRGINSCKRSSEMDIIRLSEISTDAHIF